MAEVVQALGRGGQRLADAIFDEVHGINLAADQEDGVLRISLDTKATVKIGPFSHGGYN